MALPKVKHPTFSLRLPLANIDIQLRPFTIKEEKILLVAAESKSPDQIYKAVEQVINNCVISPSIDVSQLWLFDFGLITLKLKSISASNKAQVAYTDPDDKQVHIIDVNVNDIIEENIARITKFDNTVAIEDDLFVIFKPLSYYMVEQFKNISKPSEYTTVLAKAMDKIVKGDSVSIVDDQTEEDINDWIESLSQEQGTLISKFIAGVPTVSHTVKYNNSKGVEREVTINNIEGFFIS